MSDAAIKQRADLEKQLAGAWDAYGKNTAERQAAEIELGHAQRALDSMRKARPAGRATEKEVALAEKRVDEAQSSYDRFFGRTNQALDAANGLERDRDDLLKTNLADYAEQAEAATAAAATALERLATVLRASQSAWQAASAEWAPLARAAGIGGVPPWPLPDADELLADMRAGTVVARPPAVIATT